VVLGAVGVGLYLRLAHGGQGFDSVAVLPFANQNRDAETEYLSDGLAESIINNLTQLSELRVIARSSSFRYKGKADDPFAAGRELGVRAVLAGRVLQRGETLTVSAELVDVQENTQIWGQQYNRRLADMFAVQEEIAREVAEKLRVRLTGVERQQLAKRPTENLKAFQYYVQGRAYAQRRTREDLLTAIRYCERAIGEDPGYALAYAGLADVSFSAVSFGADSFPGRFGSRTSPEAAEVLALATKAVFLVLAVMGKATLWMAVAADMGATLLVTFNGLLLLRSPGASNT
jgi:adenylate cyclase